MGHTPRRRAARAVIGLIALLVAVVAGGGGTALARPDTDKAGGPAKERATGMYIVQMLDAPVVAYGGGIPGLKATKPAKGQKVDPNSPDVTKYAAFLDGTHGAKAAGVGASVAYHYRFAFNGFAARMTPQQAAQLAASPGVVAVTKDTISTPDTSSSPGFLGLDAPGGIWSQLSGNADGNPVTANGPNSGGAGEGVVIGIIDSGIWPESASFSDRDASGRRVYQQIPGWNGRCVPGEQFNASNCNQKLVSAQYFTEGFGGGAAIKAQFPYEFVSARAADGHGVHTASTAAGNYGVQATANGIDFGTISGMAPRARVAVYKTCWGIPPEGGCPNSDNVAAIDQAVADGVDVINYSISGTSTNFRDPVEIAFLFAADAGVFVAASAGNSGPTAGTVAHPSPWITTVAASTQSREYTATLSLGNGATYTGSSLANPVGPVPIVNADAAAAAGIPVANAQRCFPGTLDPAKVAGAIVVCDRGVNARTEKGQVVSDAGGVGMVLLNTSPNSLNADIQAVPTVHLQSTDRAAVRAYAATPGATASISAYQEALGTVVAPQMAAFSSRGPLTAGGGDLLKPDITGPGVDILAAVSPVETGRDFDFLSGTSMSSPHLAGVAALMKDLYPTWSPAAIKSALMTTAYQQTITPAGGTPTTFGGPFDFGAGHVNANPARNPGLVFDAGFNDYLGFLCGTQLPTSFCTSAGVPVLDPSNLNMPSIAIGDLAGAQTVTRTVTNVSGQRATFTAATSGLPGISVTVSPASFTLNPGQTQTLQVGFTRGSAPLNAYQNGAITWTSDKGHTVRIPTVVRPVALAAPTSVSSTGSPTSYGVTFGYNGPFTVTAQGLTAAITTPGTVSQDPDQTFDPADPTGTTAIPVTIPAGTVYARFATFDADVAAGSDLDMYVYQGPTLVGTSAGGTAQEEVNFSFASPTAGPLNLTVYVHGWGVPAGTTPFVLNSFYVPASASGNMTVTAPATAVLGGPGTVNLSFSGLAPGTRYLGRVAYGGSPGMPAPTVVQVTTP